MQYFFTFCLSLFILCGCQKKSTPLKQTVRLNIGSEPLSMDSRKTSDATSIALIKLCFEGLMRRGKGGFEYGMADKVDISEDQKTYTFYLRDAYWSDGQPVTSYDFEKAWKTNLTPEFPCPFSNDLYVLKNGKGAKKGACPLDDVGVKSLDSKTLQVTLEHPCPYMFDLMAIHAFLPVPAHIVQSHPNWAEEAQETFVANGPFKLSQWQHHHQMILEKNERYWDSQVVKIEKIDLLMIADEMTALNMFESDDLDWAGNPLSTIPIDAYEALKSRLNIYPLAGVYYYIFNVKEPPFNNANLRKAFSYAINRKEIVENITQMGQSIATAAVPSILSKEESPFFTDHNVVEARRLFKIALSEMHLTKETFPPVILSYNTTTAHHRVAQAIAEEWAATFGIQVELKNMEWKAFIDELSHKNFQVARMGGIASYDDPIAFLDLFRSREALYNFSGWTHATFSALLEEADNTQNPSLRKQLLHKAQEIFLDEMPIAPIYFYTGCYLQKPHLKNVAVSEFCEIDLKHAYLEGN